MPDYVVLLRGINVGGKHPLPMAALRDLLEGLGCQEVRTYIQSGNAVLRARQRSGRVLGDAIATAIEEAHGFRPPVLALPTSELVAAVRANPFPAVTDGKALHGFLLFDAPVRPDLAGLSSVARPSEAFHLVDRVFWLHAPEGIARSKVAAQAERRLGVATTARNLSTLRELVAMCARA